jgi:hypothetical protein
VSDFADLMKYGNICADKASYIHRLVAEESRRNRLCFLI